jgi:RNA 3'-terminal phosphate cyclase-like protein
MDKRRGQTRVAMPPAAKRPATTAVPSSKPKSKKVVFEGCNQFRARLAFSVLSGTPVIIKNIRSKPILSSSDEYSHSADFHTGLTSYEASFLRLLDKLTNGSAIDINETGTAVSFTPGVLTRGEIAHTCPLPTVVVRKGEGTQDSRGIPYFIEGILPLLPFTSGPVALTFTGQTDTPEDLSVDYIRCVLMPLMAAFGCKDGWDLKVIKRGAPPLGGGEIFLSSTPVRALTPVNVTVEGYVKKIRGIAYSTKVSPQFANRLIESAR